MKDNLFYFHFIFFYFNRKVFSRFFLHVSGEAGMWIAFLMPVLTWIPITFRNTVIFIQNIFCSGRELSKCVRNAELHDVITVLDILLAS